MGFFVKNRVVETGSTGIVLPQGNSATRPASPSFGSTRLNTDTGTLEFFNGNTYTSVALQGSANITVDSFDGDGSTLTFALSVPADSETTVLVFVGSVYQAPGVVYSITGNGNDITFTEAVPSGLSVNVIHGFASTVTAP